MRPDAQGAGGVGIGNPHVDFDVVVKLIGQRDEFDLPGKPGEEFGGKRCWISHS